MKNYAGLDSDLKYNFKKQKRLKNMKILFGFFEFWGFFEILKLPRQPANPRPHANFLIWGFVFSISLKTNHFEGFGELGVS